MADGTGEDRLTAGERVDFERGKSILDTHVRPYLIAFRKGFPANCAALQKTEGRKGEAALVAVGICDLGGLQYPVVMCHLRDQAGGISKLLGQVLKLVIRKE